MGANVSTQNIESMTETINKTLTDVSNNFSTILENNNVSKQEMELYIGESIGCSFQLTQNSKNNLQAMSNFSNEISNDVANKLTNTLRQQLEQIVKQKNEGINFGQTNVSALNTISDDTLTNDIKNIINTSITSQISNTAESGQTIKITIGKLSCPENNSLFIVTQEMIIEQISDNIANNLVKNTLSNDAVNDAVKTIKQTSEQKNAMLSFGGMIIILILAAVFTYLFGYKIMCYIIPIFIAVVAYGIFYYSQTNLKITLGVLIACEVILVCLELYFIYKAMTTKNKVIPSIKIPDLPSLPSVTISTQSSSTPTSSST
jgi:hypothetical protein